MMIKNSIVKREEKPSQMTEYQSNGETVKLSPGIIRQYLVSGGGNVTNEEVMMFLSLCRFQHLNPFLREAYLIKYGESQPAAMVVGKDVFLKRARKRVEFAGFQAGIMVQTEEGNVIDREGTMYLKESEKLVGGWAKVYITGFKYPIYSAVSLDEYIGRKKSGEPNSQWASRPATMIRKVALSQALKEAFPEDNGALCVQEEVPEASGIVLEDAVVIPQEEQPEKAGRPLEAPEVVNPNLETPENPADALFNG